MKNKDNEIRSLGYLYLAGVDEAGRGPLCGPVIASAVVFPPAYQNSLIDDSKKLTPKKRESLAFEIQKSALAYAYGEASPQEIDRLNIYQASRLAMLRALSALNFSIDAIITDYMPLEFQKKPVFSYAKADANYLCVAAASILAKVRRDHYMIDLDKLYPQYGFARHKGYASKEHLAALEKYGIIEGLYRESYEPVQRLLYRLF